MSVASVNCECMCVTLDRLVMCECVNVLVLFVTWKITKVFLFLTYCFLSIVTIWLHNKSSYYVQCNV